MYKALSTVGSNSIDENIQYTLTETPGKEVSGYRSMQTN